MAHLGEQSGNILSNQSRLDRSRVHLNFVSQFLLIILGLHERVERELKLDHYSRIELYLSDSCH